MVKGKESSKKLALPTVDIDPEFIDDIIVLRLAKEGYWNGDPERIKLAPVNEVVKVLWFEGFVAQYESILFELNKGD